MCKRPVCERLLLYKRVLCVCVQGIVLLINVSSILFNKAENKYILYTHIHIPGVVVQAITWESFLVFRPTVAIITHDISFPLKLACVPSFVPIDYYYRASTKYQVPSN